MDEEITEFQVQRALVETENSFRTIELYLKNLQGRPEFVILFRKNWQRLTAEAAPIVECAG